MVMLPRCVGFDQRSDVDFYFLKAPEVVVVVCSVQSWCETFSVLVEASYVSWAFHMDVVPIGLFRRLIWRFSKEDSSRACVEYSGFRLLVSVILFVHCPLLLGHGSVLRRCSLGLVIPVVTHPLLRQRGLWLCIEPYSDRWWWSCLVYCVVCYPFLCPWWVVVFSFWENEWLYW